VETECSQTIDTLGGIIDAMPDESLLGVPFLFAGE
jgi:hypothetical protein